MGTRKTILLVEDETLVAAAEAKDLGDECYEILVVKSGREAVETFRASAEEIDLVLMDVNLGPGQDGVEAAREILAIREIPVLFLSSHAEPEIVKKAEAISSYGYVVKDAGPAVLSASIKMAFRLHEAQEEFRARAREVEVVNRKLRESEDRYRQLFEAESDALFLVDNESGWILEANTAASALYGYSRDEFLAKKNTDLSSEPEQTQRITTTTPPDPGLVVCVPLRYHRKKDGTVFPVEITGRFFIWRGRSVHIVAIRDISERRRAEEALKRSEEKFFKAFHSSPDAILISRASDGRVVDVNEGFVQISGYSRDEALASSTIMLKLWADPQDRDRTLSALAESKRVGGLEFRFRTKSGALIDGLFSAEIIMLGDESHVLSVIHDITERKKAADALARSLAEKELLMKELQHRVKNSLGVVAGLLALEGETVGEGRMRRVFADLRARINSMGGVYEQLYKGGSLDRIDFQAYVRKLAASLTASYAPDGERIQITTRLAEMEMDLKRAVPLGLILNELITNALKHAYPPERSGEIRVELDRTAEGAVLSVSDDGVGLEEGSRIAGEPGTGFKLIDMLIDQIDGQFQLKNQAGTAAIVSFRIEP